MYDAAAIYNQDLPTPEDIRASWGDEGGSAAQFDTLAILSLQNVHLVSDTAKTMVTVPIEQ